MFEDVNVEQNDMQPLPIHFPILEEAQPLLPLSSGDVVEDTGMRKEDDYFRISETQPIKQKKNKREGEKKDEAATMNSKEKTDQNMEQRSQKKTRYCVLYAVGGITLAASLILLIILFMHKWGNWVFISAFNS